MDRFGWVVQYVRPSHIVGYWTLFTVKALSQLNITQLNHEISHHEQPKLKIPTYSNGHQISIIWNICLLYELDRRVWQRHQNLRPCLFYFWTNERSIRTIQKMSSGILNILWEGVANQQLILMVFIVIRPWNRISSLSYCLPFIMKCCRHFRSWICIRTSPYFAFKKYLMEFTFAVVLEVSLKRQAMGPYTADKRRSITFLKLKIHHTHKWTSQFWILRESIHYVVL